MTKVSDNRAIRTPLIYYASPNGKVEPKELRSLEGDWNKYDANITSISGRTQTEHNIEGNYVLDIVGCWRRLFGEDIEKVVLNPINSRGGKE